MMSLSQRTPASPEYQVLLECLRAGSGARRPDASSGGRFASFDPEKLAALAQRHGVRPLLYRRLRELPAGDAVRKTQELLAPAVGRAAKQALQLSAELLAVLEALHSAGIPAIPFKGPVLATQLYGSPDLRSYRDLDLVVPLSELNRARTVLAERDYHPLYDLSPVQEGRLEKVGYHFILARKRDGMLLELHWRIADPYFSRLGEDDLLWRTRATVPFLGREVAALAPEILLPALCVHAAKHHWDQLSYVADVAAFVATQGDLDWPRVWEVAEASGSRRRLCVGLLLVQSLLGTEIPGNVLTQCRSDILAARLALRFESHFATENASHTGLVSHAWIDLAGMDTFRDRMRYCRGILSPNVSDWANNPLPPGLTPLLPLLRPLRLLRSYGLVGRDAEWRR